METGNMFLRQEKACPNAMINHMHILIVGAGAIGRQVSRSISLMGPKSVTIVDDDTVEEHNCVPQMYPQSAIGKSKVDYLAQELADYCPHTAIVPMCRRWYPIVGDHFHAVFACVDNITTRGKLFEYYAEKCEAFFDVRIGGGDHAMVLSAIGGIDDKAWYRDTIFSESEADGAGCAQPMTNFIAQVASGLVVNNFARWKSGRGAAVPRIKEYSSLSDSYYDLAVESFKNE